MLGALIGGVANIIGNAQNNKAQRETNEANLRINQMNNEFNAREAEKAFLRESQYNDKIREEDREYNSASAQVQRYREAGLNPSLMMQGQSAGVASSHGVNTSSATAAPSAPQQAVRTDYGLLGNALQGFLERKQRQSLLDEEVNGIRIENQFKAAKILQDLMESRSRQMTNEAKAKLDSTIEGMQAQILRNQTIIAEGQALQSRTQSALNVVNAAYREKELATFEQKFNVDVKEALARTAMYAANAGLSKQQTRYEIVRTMIGELEAKGVILDNEGKKLDNEGKKLDNEGKKLDYEGKKLANKERLQAINLAERVADAIVEKAIQETLPEDYRHPLGSRNAFDLRPRKYGRYPTD